MMTPEQRKVYYKSYYLANKTNILEKACTKVECEYCHRKVIKNNILKHYLLPICIRKSELLKSQVARL
jgi:hypothetical protein